MIEKNRQLVLDNVPDDYQVDAEILVDQNVSQARNPVPIHLRISQPYIFRNAFCGLTKDFEIADNSIYGFLIS